MTHEFARDGYGTAATVVQPDSAHPDVVHLADAELLHSATFQRAGMDLHLHGHDGQHLVIHGYFASTHPAALVAPNGERLTADTVAQLADKHAQAQTASST